MQELPTWERIAERFGIPVALMLAFLFLGYLISRWFAKNVIQPWLKGHLRFIKAVESANNRSVIAHRKTVERQNKILEAVQEQGATFVVAVKDQTKELTTALNPLCRYMIEHPNETCQVKESIKQIKPEGA